MIGDNIELKPHYIFPAQEIVTKIIPKLVTSKEKYFLTISGESGSGKSTLAVALSHCFHEKGIPCYIIHMDDYFKLPPLTNHHKREADISWVGPSEVNLDVLQATIKNILNGELVVDKPLVNYVENSIGRETLYPKDYRVFIIEGTYTSLLEDVNTRVFLDRTYLDTKEQRILRARDPITPFIEKVLEIEHREIASQKHKANVILNKDYSISFVNQPST